MKRPPPCLTTERYLTNDLSLPALRQNIVIVVFVTATVVVSIAVVIDSTQRYALTPLAQYLYYNVVVLSSSWTWIIHGIHQDA